MKRFGIGMLSLVVAMSFSSTWACDNGCAKAGGQDDPAKVKAQAASSEANHSKEVCPDAVEAGVAHVMKSMPKMVCKVGDLETSCSKTACAKAKASGAKVAYVIGGETFDTKVVAMDRLAELMTAELPKVMAVAYVVGDEVTHCSKSAAKLASEKRQEATPMVAGVPFESAEKAQAVADQLAAKMKTLAVSETTTSPKSAGRSKFVCGKTAAGATGGCSKAQPAEAKTASLESGSRSESESESQVATVATNAEDSVDRDEDTPALANAKRMVREIVEFVVASQAS